MAKPLGFLLNCINNKELRKKYVCICAILQTWDIFSFNSDVNWLPCSISTYGYSKLPAF